MSSTPPKTFLTKKLDEVIIRTAEKKDAEKIIKIMKEVIEESKYTLAEPGEYKATKTIEEDKIHTYFKAPGKLILAAEAAGKVVGFLEYSNWPLKRTLHCGMLSMFILKDYRDKGIGKLLMECLIEWAEKNPIIEKLSLAVFSTNERAIALYEKTGFVVEGRCPRDMKMPDGSYVDSILMYRFVK